MTNATDALRALIAELARDVHYAIADDGLAPLSPPDNNAMREAIQRVLTPERIAALATPAGSASGDDGMCYCQEDVICPACEIADGGPYNGIDWQATCETLQAEVARAREMNRALADDLCAAEAEAARLRELVWWMDDRVFRWEGLSVSGYASKYACSDEDEAMTTRLDEVLSQQDAAMGSANGQG